MTPADLDELIECDIAEDVVARALALLDTGTWGGKSRNGKECHGLLRPDEVDPVAWTPYQGG